MTQTQAASLRPCQIQPIPTNGKLRPSAYPNRRPLSSLDPDPCLSPHSRAVIVEKLCEYLSYKSLYESAKKNEEIPDFQERVYPEISLEL